MSYIVGGLVPLCPYMLFPHEPKKALHTSVLMTLVALGIFGAVKGRALGSPVLRSAFQTVAIGGLAAGMAFLLARLLNSSGI